MEWKVFVENFNAKKIEPYDIFNHYGFANDCIKCAKKKNITKEDFAEEIMRSLTYFFWSKCEWEIILSSFPPSDRVSPKKISVYDQVALNKDIFIDYLWEHKKELAKCTIS